MLILCVFSVRLKLGYTIQCTGDIGDTGGDILAGRIMVRIRMSPVSSPMSLMN